MKRSQTDPALNLRDYLAEIGRRGGTISRRELTKPQARRMVAIREAKRAARKAGIPLAEINSWRLRIDRPALLPDADYRKSKNAISPPTIKGFLPRGKAPYDGWISSSKSACSTERGAESLAEDRVI